MQVTKALACKWREKAIYQCGVLLISGKFGWCLHVRKLELTLAPSAMKIMVTKIVYVKVFLPEGTTVWSCTGNQTTKIFIFIAIIYLFFGLMYKKHMMFLSGGWLKSPQIRGASCSVSFVKLILSQTLNPAEIILENKI